MYLHYQAKILSKNLINPTLVYEALKNSVNGLIHVVKTERAFQQELIILITGSAAALFLTTHNLERALLIGCIFLVLIFELMNTAIEAAVDRIDTREHQLSKIAKDVGSSAVLMSIVLAIVIWLLLVIF
ncbi:MAG: diacylglycerol kinase [SAR202 cluster bacterium]|nr:diacylglycerol kinase [SAR202 cluster bacterium]